LQQEKFKTMSRNMSFYKTEPCQRLFLNQIAPNDFSKILKIVFEKQNNIRIFQKENIAILRAYKKN